MRLTRYGESLPGNTPHDAGAFPRKYIGMPAGAEQTVEPSHGDLEVSPAQVQLFADLPDASRPHGAAGDQRDAGQKKDCLGPCQ